MFYAGLDLGTSGVRVCVIDQQHDIIAEAKLHYPHADKQTCEMWWQSCCQLIRSLPKTIRTKIGFLAIDGTSGSVLLVNNAGQPVTEPLLYNDHDASFTMPDKDLSGLNDTFIRVLRLLEQVNLKKDFMGLRIVTQADYIKGKLTGYFGISDQNNCFKLGYDVATKQWPSWMADYGVTTTMLPKVLSSGQLVSVVLPSIAKALSLSSDLQLVAGTTDSVAAVMATKISQVGSAVTSLGSTMVLKVLSDKPITAPEYGVYSQPYFNQWLVGGASNCGGQILRQYFDDVAMQSMTKQMNIQVPTGIHYYPLTKIGERFPVNDPQLEPVLTPRPDNDVVFFQALLESLSRVESTGYQLLKKLGAPLISEITTVGGGSENKQWMKMREAVLGIPVNRAEYTEAAYGAALLASDRGDLSK
ncbi:MAG: FGGY-family carbohydrate kinase [Thiotrichaceae bacterium]